MSGSSIGATVHQFRFEGLGGRDFERLVFAYLLRTSDWLSLDWFGQSGSDSGRDIWGIQEDDRFPGGQKICVQCANWKKLTLGKVEGDLAKLKKSGRLPDRCIVVAGGAVSADLRDAIKAAVGKVIRECEIWSGPEFEERLRHKAESLLKRFVQGELFPDTANELRKFVGTVQTESDEERLALMASLFDRPAFYTPFTAESSVPAFRKAITDTIEALGTGIHRLRDGTEIRRIPSRHQLSSENSRNHLASIEKKLAKLRSEFDGLLKSEDIRPCGCNSPDCPVFQASPLAARKMDSFRNEILDAFRDLYPRFKVRLGF